MTLPQDVEERFEGWKTGDATKDAVLADAGSAQTAVTYAVTKGDPESPALRFYQSGSALAGSQDWVKGIVDAGLTYSGSVRYFAPEIRVFDKQSASVSYCADESKAYNKNRKTNKVDHPRDRRLIRALQHAPGEERPGGLADDEARVGTGEQKCVQ
ncbi:hypothetical protein SALBM217S_07703 [Streptomyces griseoloalbus]